MSCVASRYLSIVCTAAAVIAGTLAPSRASAATLIGLGYLPGDLSSSANSVSGDGSVVVGTSGGYGGQAFRWTAAGGMVGLGRPPGDFYSYARGVSGDASVVVGGSDYAEYVDEYTEYYRTQAFRWTAGGDMQSLGHLSGGGLQSVAVGVSADGSAIVGNSDSALGYEAFRWTAAGGMQGLGDLPGGGFQSEASGVSADGSVIVGYGTAVSFNSEAFRWTSAGGMVGLGFLTGDRESQAYGVSADGSIVVGTSSSTSGVHIFRWTSADGMVGLGSLPGDFSPWGFSADGSVVVGYEIPTGPDLRYTALYWTPDGGSRPLWDVLLANGVNPAAYGWSSLQLAKGISADGNTIVGDGIRNGNVEAFVAVLNARLLPGDYNDDGTVDAADYTVWRDNAGAPAGTLMNDANGGIIGPAQYATWRANFGNTLPTATVFAGTVPEPTSVVLCGLLAAPLLSARRGVRVLILARIPQSHKIDPRQLQRTGTVSPRYRERPSMSLRVAVRFVRAFAKWADTMTKSSRSILPTVSTKGIVAVVLLAGFAEPASAQYLTVVGGPTFTPGVGGYGGGNVWSLDGLGAVGYVNKVDASRLLLGAVPFRWSINSSGTEIQWTELGILGNQAAVPGAYDNPGGYAKAMDAAGNVVGFVVDRDDVGSQRDRPVRWNAGGTTATELANLGTTPDGNTWGGALDVNAAGTIVGFAEKFDASGLSQGWRALRWDASGAMTELGTLDPKSTAGAFAYNLAGAINDAGTAIGVVDKYDAAGIGKGQRAVRWDASSTAPTELANLGTDASGFTETVAVAINSAGVIVGTARKFDANGQGRTVPVRWDVSGAVTELETLQFPELPYNFGQTRFATRINDAGVVIGGLSPGGAVRWDASGAAVELMSPLDEPRAFDINNAGIAVGASNRFAPSRALYWGLDAVPVDLNSLIDPASGWTLTSADAINDAGWIGGNGLYDPDGPGGQAAIDRLFLLHIPAAAVPEPAARALALVGVGSILLVRRGSLGRPNKLKVLRFQVVGSVLTLAIVLATGTASAQEADTITISGTFSMGTLAGTVGPDLAEVYANGYDHTWKLTLHGTTQSHFSNVDWENTLELDATTIIHAMSFDLEFFGPDAATLNGIVSEHIAGGDVGIRLDNIYPYVYGVDGFSLMDVRLSGPDMYLWARQGLIGESTLFPADADRHPVVGPEPFSMWTDYSQLADSRPGNDGAIISWDSILTFVAGIPTVPEPTGDFNHDGTVDAADYVVWRRNNIDGESGYNIWRGNFGATAAGAAAVALAASLSPVPEPGSAMLAAVAIAVCGLQRIVKPNRLKEPIQ